MSKAHNDREACWVWVVVHKRSGQILVRGGIEFEEEKGKCPALVKINPIYKDEYENKRISI